MTLNTHSSTQTRVETRTSGTQHSPNMEDKDVQCDDNIIKPPTTAEVGSNTEMNIRIPMEVTLNMGNAHDLPKWEWP